MWNQIFNPENAFWLFMAKITDLFFVSLLFLVFSLPVFTIGASTSALFNFILKQYEEREGHVFRTFFTAFKKNFKQATIIFLLSIVAVIFFYVDYYAIFNFEIPPLLKIMSFGVITFLAIVVLIILVYIYPLTAFYKIQTRKAVKDAFLLGLKKLGFTFLIIIVYIIFGFLSYKYTYFTVFFVSLAIFCVTPIMVGIFKSLQE